MLRASHAGENLKYKDVHSSGIYNREGWRHPQCLLTRGALTGCYTAPKATVRNGLETWRKTSDTVAGKGFKDDVYLGTMLQL